LVMFASFSGDLGPEDVPLLLYPRELVDAFELVILHLSTWHHLSYLTGLLLLNPLCLFYCQ